MAQAGEPVELINTPSNTLRIPCERTCQPHTARFGRRSLRSLTAVIECVSRLAAFLAVNAQSNQDGSQMLAFAQ